LASGFAFQIEPEAVRCEQDIGVHAAQFADALASIFDNVWVLGVVRQFVQRCREAAEEKYIVVLAVFGDAHRPTRTALCVSRREVRSESHAAQFDAIAIRNDAVRFDGFIRLIVSPEKISFATACHQFAIELASHDCCARAALELRKPTAMVDVSVAIEQELDVLRLEAQLFHVGRDLRQHLHVARI
jgi:hypothetical protein